MTEVVDINTRMDLVAKRLIEIKQRMAAIKELQSELTKEYNELWSENEALQVAEKTYQKYIK